LTILHRWTTTKNLQKDGGGKREKRCWQRGGRRKTSHLESRKGKAEAEKMSNGGFPPVEKKF